MIGWPNIVNWPGSEKDDQFQLYAKVIQFCGDRGVPIIGTPRESGLEADEELALFHSFVSVAPNRANLRAEPIMSWLATQWASMWAIIEGTRNWLMGEIATLSSLPAGIWQPTGPQSSRPKIDWNDYAELMDEALSD